MDSPISDRRVLCLVVDRASARHPLEDAVRAAVAEGVDRIQLRDRALEGADFLAWADQLSRAAAPAEIVVNRRLDVALCLSAGVHLGFDAVSPDDARRLLGPGPEVGVSAHAPQEVAEAASRGASYAHLAPIYAPLSKPATRPPLGPAAIEAAARAGIPVLAQGGITADRVAAVCAAGAAGIAVTGAVLLADDPGAAAAALRSALDR